MSDTKKDKEFLGDEEWLIQYCKNTELKDHHDYYIFGHRHLPHSIEIAKNSKYINIGDWLMSYTFGVFDGKEMKLEKYEA